MDENHSREAEEELNAFQNLPFEMNEMILNNLDPISMLNFGKTSKFCDGLADNFDDRVFDITWNGLKKGAHGPDVIKFRVQNSPDSLYTLEVKKARSSSNSGERRGRRRPFFDSESDSDEEFSSIFDNNLLLQSAEPEYNYDDEKWSKSSRHETVAILKKYETSSKTSVVCWEQTKKGSCFDVAAHYFFDLLKRHQNSMKNLSIKYYRFMSEFIDQNYRLNDLLVPKSLENIKVYGIFPDIHKLYSIDNVSIFGTPLNIEKLCQFKSSILGFTTFSMNMEIYKQYLILWRDGKLHENLKFLEIIDKTSDIIQILFRENFAVETRSRGNTEDGTIKCFAIVKTNKNNLRLYGKVSPVDSNLSHVGIYPLKGEDVLKSIENFTD
ncbi:unnamed protein product [Caenorhabditis angaria]|uniref:F-box domain-containing protein n=1 Tax=Caenorhabditis angaria TaxID=860376 RepID=A0A9P1IST1_9PELO|nr:unnamed protein product [Caenorhabditis angaria]